MGTSFFVFFFFFFGGSPVASWGVDATAGTGAKEIEGDESSAAIEGLFFFFIFFWSVDDGVAGTANGRAGATNGLGAGLTAGDEASEEVDDAVSGSCCSTTEADNED